MNLERPALRVAIACGGTGGHLFPGLAVGHELIARGSEVTLLISPKEVDQQAVRGLAHEFDLVTLPAVGLSGRNYLKFLAASLRSWHEARRAFKSKPPQAVLAMGGFTSTPPVLAGKGLGAAAFLHDSNTIPGRANRWLAPWVDECFVGFATAARHFRRKTVVVTGTPVRPQFLPMDPVGARAALGFNAAKPLLLVVGGSQGASGLNRLVVGALPSLAAAQPDLQFFHLTGPQDYEEVKAAYEPLGRRARVQPFCSEMELPLGAATLALSRSGASSLAELAAMQVPAILVPFPAATDNHQFHNAASVVETGGAVMLEQRNANSAMLAQLVTELGNNPARLQSMSAAMARGHRPNAAAEIADRILAHVALQRSGVTVAPSQPALGATGTGGVR